MQQLSKPQMAIYEMDRFSGGSIANIAGDLILNEKADFTRLENAINSLLHQNDVLRTNILLYDGIPMQTVSPYCKTSIQCLSFRNIDEYTNWAKEKAKTPIDLFETLSDFTAVSIGGDRCGIFVKIHHILGDAWSMKIICDELLRHYSFGKDKQRVFPYRDYLLKEKDYCSSDRYFVDKNYWFNIFDKNNESAFLCEKLSESNLSARKHVTLKEEETQKIKCFCERIGISEFQLFLATFSIYFYRITGNRNFYIGIPVLNRTDKREMNTIGTFVNTIPLSINLDNNRDFIELCKNIQTDLFSAYRHQKFLYSELLKSLRTERGHDNVLFDVILSYQNAKMDNTAKVNWYPCGMQTESLQIHIDDRNNTGLFNIDYDYQTEKFTESDIERMHEHFINLLNDAFDNTKGNLSQLKMMSDDEINTILYKFNNKSVDYPKKYLHSIIEERTREMPNKMAVVACDESLTFHQLNNQANSIADTLLEKSVGNDDVIVLLLPRKSYLLSAILGVLKSGAAYLLLDMNYPENRINFMIENCCAKAIIASKDFSKKISSTDRIVFVEEMLDRGISSDPNVALNESNLFCALHTSGSTGTPKLTGLIHKNMMNFVYATDHLFEHVQNSLSTTTVAFDAFILETLLALSHGIKVILFNEIELGNQRLFEDKVCKYTDSFIFQTPTRLKSFIENSNHKIFLKHISTFVVGGEVFPPMLYEMIKTNNDNSHIFNIYGPTEATICTTIEKITRCADITIGSPIDNTNVYILDNCTNLLPIGAKGELCIAGAGVGKGYINNAHLTADKFVSNPFSDDKMYKTGDLARWRDDGCIEYIGRIDNQVKIRGLRIELGEIESAISRCDDVKQNAVVIKTDGKSRQYICAYYIGDKADVKKIRSILAEQLPQYMIPHVFIPLKSFPITQSGKMDYNALPMPDFTQIRQYSEYSPPVTKTEKILATLMSKVLHIPDVGIHDSFFDIGGDSLKAIEFVSNAHNSGFCFTLQNVFDFPSIAKLIECIQNENKQLVAYSIEDFQKFEHILSKNKITTSFKPDMKPIGNVLITGVTGYLGAHILDEFLKNEKGTAYCFVRGSDISDSVRHIENILTFYFGDAYRDNKRIKVICGDITKKIKIDVDVDAIFHCAATVKHYGSYKHFYDNNVLGTQNIIELAKEKDAKLFHISTLSVSGNSFGDQFDGTISETELFFHESDLYIGQPLNNVYARSKFEAEVAVFNAILDGLQANIMRMGNLTNRYRDSKFQVNHKENAFAQRIKAALEFGLFPDYILPLYAEFSPIDYAADAVLRIAQNYNPEYTVFHINSHKPVYFKEFLKVLDQLKIKLQVVDAKQFADKIREVARESDTAYIYESFVNDMDNKGELQYESNIHIKNNFSVWYLNKIGFDWPEIDIRYLEKYFNYFRNIGYLEV